MKPHKIVLVVALISSGITGNDDTNHSSVIDVVASHKLANPGEGQVSRCVKELSMFSFSASRQYECRGAAAESSSRRCIPLESKCDGNEDCPQGDDETDCVLPTLCPFAYTPCRVGQCVHLSLSNDYSLCKDRSMFCDKEYREIFERQCKQNTLTKNCEVSCDGQCLLEYDVCDGINDCKDERDENAEMCAKRPCPSDLKCLRKWAETDTLSCLPEYFICDGYSQCENGADEDAEFCRNRPCPPGQIKCTNGTKCLQAVAFCNGYHDCSNGEDEDTEFCRNRRCPEDYFKCISGSCLDESNVCDGNPDCPDGDDEDGAMCQIVKDECERHSANDYSFTPSSKIWDETHSRCNRLEIACISYYLGRDSHAVGGMLAKCANMSCNMNTQVFHCSTAAADGDIGNSRYPTYCLHEHLVCDGTPDCYGGEDEDPTLCTPSRPCFPSQFKCGDGRCVSDLSVCNGVQDCSNNADEDTSLCHPDRVCPPTLNMLPCGDGQCIRQQFVCNSIVSCKNGRYTDTDVMCQSPNFECPVGSYTCSKYIRCFPEQRSCSDDVGRYCEESVAVRVEEECRRRAGEPCPSPGQVSCGSGQCVDEDYVCSGLLDLVCLNGALSSDSYCRARRCREDQFSCGGGQCISMEKVCDGQVTHCGQTGRDEWPTVCSNNTSRSTHPAPAGATAATVTTNSAGECVDVLEYCPDLARRGVCQSYGSFAADHCRMSCNLCDAGAGSGGAGGYLALPPSNVQDTSAVPRPPNIINYYYNIHYHYNTNTEN